MLELLKTYAETETELQCFCSSEEKMSDTFTWIQSRFTSISAAGGLVENSRGEFLLIYRKGHWDLPKGKSETGESLESCALREVEEETGLKFIRMGKFLCTTWHIYPLKKEWILKDSHWYKMFTSELTPLIPQTEEDILKAEWISPEKIQTLYPEMYPLIRDIFIVNLYGKDPQ